MPPNLSNPVHKSSSSGRPFFALPALFLDAVYPPRCAGCSTFCETLFCASCHETLQPVGALHSIRTPREYSQIVEDIAPAKLPAHAAFLFDGALREAIYRFKYEGKTALAAPLAELMVEQFHGAPENLIGKKSAPFAANALRGTVPIFVPVPLHAWRKWRRGYNQSELLARELARMLQVLCVPLLRRALYTTTQTDLSRAERLQNIQGAFAPDEKAVRGLAKENAPLSFILIDDVYTTGATLEECARVLRLSFRDAAVSAWTLAYQPPH